MRQTKVADGISHRTDRRIDVDKVNKFKVGDVVEIVNVNNPYLKDFLGKSGTIVSIKGQNLGHYLVDFSTRKSGQSKWCCSENSIDLIGE